MFHIRSMNFDTNLGIIESRWTSCHLVSGYKNLIETIENPYVRKNLCPLRYQHVVRTRNRIGRGSDLMVYAGKNPWCIFPG